MKTIDLTAYQDRVFFTSDTHFNHYNICRYCNRPFKDRREMNETLIANWNKVVPKNGIVIHCGDFMLNHSIDDEKLYDRIASCLNGKIYLVRGNHDIIRLRNNSRKKITWVGDMLNIKIGDDCKIIASHYPLVCFAGNYNVFGHVHSLSNGRILGPDAYYEKWLNDNRHRQFDVGVDRNNYQPISLFTLFNKIGKE